MSRSPTERLLWAGDGVADAQGVRWPDFEAWCAAHVGARVELLAAADRAHSLCVPDDLPLADDDALSRYARLQFTHYFGPAAQQWPLAVQGRVACALAEADALTALQATATAHRVRLASLRPSWALAPVQDGDWAVVEGGLLTWLQRRDGQLVSLQQRHVDDALMQELADAHVLQAKDLLAQAGPRTGPDFIAQPTRLRPLIWGWAAAAAAACALVTVQAVNQHDEAQRLAEQAAVLDRIGRPAVPASKAKADPATRQRAWAVARQLNTDWGTLWSDVERALPPGLQLTTLDLDRQALRLEGQTTDPDTVTRLVDQLAQQAAPGDDVVLTRLQRPDTPGDAGALRFELVRRSGAPR